MSVIFKQSIRALLRTSSGRSCMIPAVSIAIRLNSTADGAAANASTDSSSINSKKTDTPVDSKIAEIVRSISKLTLMETSALIKELKSKLDIPDIAFPVAGTAGAAAPQAAEDIAKEEPKQKTIFNLKLESFDPKSKAKVIKEVKSELGLSLVKAKKLVESAPKILKENMSKEDAEKFKETLEKHGAKVTLE
ncbi:hypothetical protein FOA43_003685 [Brettanomyces nanus]|uniref:50S ribosomal protein L7/L12 n=1 Tax=Eeniella nana TaxID=13502 RepID=A0A875S9I7_EENNA|nr:uncharacterized protein FOA43_003685 [Brettanomyces nanus]QPG76299.1 hypothetical protein FOA43_003685 [Brettanomyces nanus]